MKKTTKFILVIIMLMSITTAAYAAKCSYCKRQYGEAMPGDEKRVYALRRQHEVNCEKRPGDKVYSASKDVSNN